MIRNFYAVIPCLKKKERKKKLRGKSELVKKKLYQFSKDTKIN